MSKPTISFLLELASLAAKEIKDAGDHIQDVKMSYKVSRSDLVTQADERVEKLLVEAIKAKYPTHKFFCEEHERTELTNDPTWVIDPIDGTTNFFHTFPLHACSIGYLENKEPLLGVVTIPHTNEVFHAEKGKGAFVNGKRISVAPPRPLEESLISTGFSVSQLHSTTDKTHANNARNAVIHNFTALLDGCRDLRRTGACSVDLCYVACGRQDAFAEFGPHEWDFAAGMLIVREAGGYLAGYEGDEFNLQEPYVVAASSDKLAKQVSSLLKKPF